jgi:serine/threonine protein kinase
VAVFICQGCGTEHSSWEGNCPKCGTSETIRLSPATDKMVDRVIKGKYKIVRRLGQGGMGAVYLAEQIGIGHRVAIKFLKTEFSDDAEIARRFLNEAKSYARVAHPNAVTFHDFGQDDDGNLFIAMEYCEGIDLKKTLAEQGRLQMVEAVEVTLQVADVLANAHEKGVIHRDLKPENIMIRRGIRGVHAKVLDFGIARLMDAGTKLTMAGAIAGTPRYMSPEQVRGREVDARADIYSLGIVLFETLTGNQPFDGTSISEILQKQVADPLPPLAQFATDLDYPEMESVIRRACAKNPEERWPDMLSFASALSQSIPTQAHLALPPLQRTGQHGALSRATPRPAVPDDIAGTVVRLETQVKPLPLGQQTLDHGHATQMETAPKPPKKSPAPIIGLVAALVLIGGTVVWFVAGSKEMAKPPEPTPPVVTKVDPPIQKQPDAPPQVDNTATAAVQMLRDEQARGSLARAQTEFEVARFDEAETYLKAIAPDSSSFIAADLLTKKIVLIRDHVKTANALRAKGSCEAALPVYKQILELNPRVKDALDGSAACKQGTVNTTME